MNRNRLLTSVLFGVPAVLMLLFAIFICTRGGGWFSFIFSCPFWSAAILLILAAVGLSRTALFGSIGCLIMGGVAFVAGFFGPIIFTPNANQGPLLGIFFTGPIATLVGTILGILTAIVMKGIRQPKDGQVFSESAPNASSEKPSS